MTAQLGYRLKVLDHEGQPSMSLRESVRQMVEDRATAKQVWGKGSLEEQTIKVATNSGYGKLAQDVEEHSGWDAWEQMMESIGGSSITSPYHAAMITSLVRALLLGMSNELRMLSVTTDGFITSHRDIEHFSCFGLANVFRDSRIALSGESTVWEVKHQQSDLVNFMTRGNVSLEPGGVIARAGVKVPDSIFQTSIEDPADKHAAELAERQWLRHEVVSRTGKIANEHTTFPCFRELSRDVDRLDFHVVNRSPGISLDFDMKRRPVIESMRAEVVDGYEIACFETVPWDTVNDYRRGRSTARHIAARRPGTTGENRPSGCLRTVDEWETWHRRFMSSNRRIRTADSALLTELVAAHKEGLMHVPVLASRVPVEEKLIWLSSLGLGDFTRAQWDHLGKKDRRARVVKSLNLDALADLVENSSDW
ncbi:MAG: hypothetical protein E6049_09440 [Varibaculum cambriense]|nr:hypothetical protein [Varibaculum cambriense]